MKTLPHQDSLITGASITLREFTTVLSMYHEYMEKDYGYWCSDEPAEVLSFMDWYFLDTPPHPLPTPEGDDFYVLVKWAAHVFREGNEINWPSTFVPPDLGVASEGNYCEEDTYDEEDGQTIGKEMLF